MTREAGFKFKEAAWEVMEKAYNKASGNGSYTALARQIMYAARPYIQEKVGKDLQSKYFTQVLLPDYIAEFGCQHWKTGYDPRGHLIEPHDGKILSLGTDEVRHFLKDIRDPKHVVAALTGANIDFNGPKHNWSGLLFIEKEGFGPLLREAQFADRYDLATMSTKGMSVTAARDWPTKSARSSTFRCLSSATSTRPAFPFPARCKEIPAAHEFKHSIQVIELGLSLVDVTALGLEFEYQVLKKGRKDVLVDNLYENGATAEEVAFMFADWEKHPGCLRRVEVNALTSPQFVQFLDNKLRQHGIEKVVHQSRTSWPTPTASSSATPRLKPSSKKPSTTWMTTKRKSKCRRTSNDRCGSIWKTIQRHDGMKPCRTLRVTVTAAAAATNEWKTAKTIEVN